KVDLSRRLAPPSRNPLNQDLVRRCYFDDMEAWETFDSILQDLARDIRHDRLLLLQPVENAGGKAIAQTVCRPGQAEGACGFGARKFRRRHAVVVLRFLKGCACHDSTGKEKAVLTVQCSCGCGDQRVLASAARANDS